MSDQARETMLAEAAVAALRRGDATVALTHIDTGS
jgi:hypothetical protein